MGRFSSYDDVTTSGDSDLLLIDQSPYTGASVKNITTQNFLKNRPFVTVGSSNADYTTDGTADDVQVQAAVDALITLGGGTLFIKSGDYDFTNSVTIVGSDIIVRGAGSRSKITLANSVNKEIFVVGDASTACNDVSFYDMYLDGNKASNAGSAWGGAPGGTKNVIRYRSDSLNSYGGVVDGVHVVNSPQNGLSNESHQYLTFRNCRVEDSDDYGIWHENGDNFNVEHCWVIRGTLGGHKSLSAGVVSITDLHSLNDNVAGITLQSVGRASIVGCRIERSGYHNGVSDVASNGLSLSSSNVQMIGNTIYGCMAGGMSLNGVTHSTFVGNLFRRNGQLTDNTYSDISMSGTACTNNNFVGNVFRNDTATGFTNKVAYNITGGASHTANILTNGQMGAPGTSFFNSFVTGNTIRNNGLMDPERLHVQGNVTGATTFNRVNGDTITATLTGNITVTLTDGVGNGDKLKLILTQDGTGSRLVTWPSNFKKAGGALTLSTGAAAVDTIEMVWDGTNWREVSRSLNLS